MSSRKTDEYVDRCCDRILELLLEHHALVHPEIEARVSEGYYRSSNRNIDPHHVTTALRNLTKRDILRLRTTTRGGRAIETVQLTHPARRLVRRGRRPLPAPEGSGTDTPTRLIGPCGPSRPPKLRCTSARRTRLRRSPVTPGERSDWPARQRRLPRAHLAWSTPNTDHDPGRGQEHSLLGVPLIRRAVSTTGEGRPPSTRPPDAANHPDADLPKGASHLVLDGSTTRVRRDRTGGPVRRGRPRGQSR